MRLTDWTIEGLTEEDIGRYIRVTRSAILIDKFKQQIATLRRAGFPWTEISTKLERLTGKKLSASTIKAHMGKEPNTSKSKAKTVGTKSIKAMHTNEPIAPGLMMLNEQLTESYAEGDTLSE